jgi:hypothetical protein
MLSHPPTTSYLRVTFARVWDAIMDGSLDCAPECNGLDESVRDALNELAADKSARNQMAARSAFVCQLSAIADR